MKPQGRFWFWRLKTGAGWQLKLWPLFIFSSIYSVGFRLWGVGIGLSIRGIHKMTFVRREVHTGRLHFEWLHPCCPSRPYQFIRSLFA